MLDKPQELLQKENEIQITVHRELETEEKLRSHPPLADPADVSAQTDQEQLKNDILTLHEAKFKTPETELIPAKPVFRQKANYYEQSNPIKINQSRSKSARKHAAAQQAQSDQTRQEELQLQLNHLNKRLTDQKDPDSLLARSVLTEDLGILNHSPARQDVTGHFRRKNAKKYTKPGSGNDKVRESAQADVDNLVSNLRRDISLEGDTSLLEDTSEYTDAFYFTNLFGEETIKGRTQELEEMKKNADQYSSKEIDASKARLKKLQDMVLFLKNYGSTYSIAMVQKSRAIKAHQLARQQIADEGNSAYNQLMLEILDKKISELKSDYEENIKDLRTASNTADTPQGKAHIKVQKELAKLRRRMKENDSDEQIKKKSMDQARDIFQNFT